MDERERKDYFNPSKALFADHCNQIVDRYCLEPDCIKHEIVEDIDYVDFDEHVNHGLFTVQTNKATHRARVVVLAIGAGNQPTMPGLGPHERVEGACHAAQIVKF